MKNGINGKLEEAFKQEDARIQGVVKVVKERIGSEDPEEVKELGSKGRVALLTRQKYSLSKGRPAGQWDLVVTSEALPNFPLLEDMEPAGFAASLTGNCEVSVSFTPLFRKEEEEEEALRRAGISLGEGEQCLCEDTHKGVCSRK